MRQKLTATIGCLALSCALHAQNGWLPPVTFPANANACDASPWQLVFSDDFNGSTINHNNWNTFISWPSMNVYRGSTNVQVNEHPYWSKSRTCNSNALFLDDNVIVNNGICRIQLRYVPGQTITYRDSTVADWPIVTLKRDYTTGTLFTPYNLSNGQPNAFNSGRFEASIRFPDFKNVWCAFWLMYGGTVNEIDIAEMWGGVHPPFAIGAQTRTEFNNHAWGPDKNQANPYNLPYNVTLPGNTKYPHQSWWDWLWGHQFKTEDWHAYTCEWDTASLKAYVDNNLSFTYWKYSQKRKYGLVYLTVGSGCQPTAGNWDITYAYPWNSTNSNCALRISGGFGDDIKPPNDHKLEQTMGSILIDYVRVWQKHPEKDGHAAICADNTYPATPLISGPQQVCPIGAFTVSPALSDGKWNASNQFALSNNTGSTASLYKQAGPAFYGGWISYSYGNGNAACPLKTVFKNNLYCNKATDWQVAQTFAANNYGTSRIYFITEPYFKRDVTNNTTPIIRWDMDFTNGQDTYDAKNAQHYTMYGTFASSPDFTFGQGLPYNLKWTMIAYNGSDTIKKTGERNSQTALFQQARDTNTYYLNAYIDDQDNYDNTVSNEVPSRMVSEAEFADTLFVNEMIEKIKAEALEPYIIGADNSLMNKKVQGVTASTADAATKIYPNPIHSKMTIIAGSKFEDKTPIQISIYNLVGKLIKTQTLGYVKGNSMQFDMSGVASGNYIVVLKQNNLNDHIKITKE